MFDLNEILFEKIKQDYYLYRTAFFTDTDNLITLMMKVRENKTHVNNVNITLN